MRQRPVGGSHVAELYLEAAVPFGRVPQEQNRSPPHVAPGVPHGARAEVGLPTVAQELEELAEENIIRSRRAPLLNSLRR